jgi:four helix bundle protein
MQFMKRSFIREKAYSFALNIIKLYQSLVSRNEYVISRQVLKSGTSIGANVEEALAGQSRADFLSKMSIASKEARESNYWLRLLRDSSLCTDEEVREILDESERVLKMLTAIVKTTRSGMLTKN